MTNFFESPPSLITCQDNTLKC